MIARLVSGRGLAGQAQDFPKFEPCVDRTLTPRYVLDLDANSRSRSCRARWSYFTVALKGLIEMVNLD